MPTFRVQLDTPATTTVTDAELAAVFSTIAAAGGTDVSIIRTERRRRPRVGFSLEALSRDQTVHAVYGLLVSLAAATPSIVGGWLVESIGDLPL